MEPRTGAGDVDSAARKLLHFDGFSVDFMRCAVLRGGEEIWLRPKAFDVLRYLVERTGRLVNKEELIRDVWPGVFVTDDSLVQCVRDIREALRDDARTLIKTIPRRGYLFAGEARETFSSDSQLVQGAAVRNDPRAAIPAQDVTFCRTADGVPLAIAQSGNGAPVIKIGTWLTHVEADWQSPVWAPLLAVLTSRFRLIRYDPRGCGLSGRQVADLSFEALLLDLETVVDTLGLQRVGLLGISRGAPIAIAYAARHPERVTRLVLHGGYPLGRRKRRGGTGTAMEDALATLIQHRWEQSNPVFQQLLTSRFLPDATSAEAQWLNEMQRITTMSDDSIRVRYASSDIDVTELLPHVAAPTLVLHSRGDVGVPFEMGLMLARDIPNARFVALDSRNHLILAHEPVWERFIAEVCGFLGE
jgi:pimeloyl-ACP methyl ester carboxylesterase/DNA-binding winged helix-turn-helix (wHTH) protein